MCFVDFNSSRPIRWFDQCLPSQMWPCQSTLRKEATWGSWPCVTDFLTKLKGQVQQVCLGVHMSSAPPQPLCPLPPPIHPTPNPSNSRVEWGSGFFLTGVSQASHKCKVPTPSRQDVLVGQ